MKSQKETKIKIMKATFEKQEFNTEFDYNSDITKMFNEMGYTKFNINTCFTNGLSHYVSLNVTVLNEGKCFCDMYINEDNTTDITIRISNHDSNLSRFGVVGNKMTMNNFKKLILTQAIANNN